MTGATVSRVAGHTVLLTAARSTQYLELDGEEDGNSIEDELGRALTPVATICRLGFSPAFNEVDLVLIAIFQSVDLGLAPYKEFIFCIEPRLVGDRVSTFVKDSSDFSRK